MSFQIPPDKTKKLQHNEKEWSAVEETRKERARDEWERRERERWVGVGWGTERRKSRCCWKHGETAAEGGSLSGLLRLKFQSTPEGGRFWSSCLRSECTWRASIARASARGSASGSGSANASVTCQPTPLKRLCLCLWLWHCLTPTSHRIGASFPPPLSLSPSLSVCAYFIQITTASLGFMWLYWPEHRAQ